MDTISKCRILCTFFFFSFSLSAFPFVSKSECTHEFEKDTVEATCTQDGRTTKYCPLCDSLSVKVVSALGHKLFTTDSLKATCKETGLVTKHCSRCDTIIYVTIPLKSHKYETTDSAKATCLEEGLVTKKCSRCDTVIYVTIPPKGHKYEKGNSIEATCTKSGYDSYKCARCGLKDTVFYEALGHDYKAEIREATMEKDGYTKYTCKRCSTSYKADTVKKYTAKEYYSALKFSEIMPCNISTYLNKDNYNFSGYVELQNTATNHRVNLKHCVLTHYKKTKSSYSLKGTWEIKDSIDVLSSSYEILWMDEMKDKKRHAPFKLDADGGYLTLYVNGSCVDSIAYGAMDAHISYGRYDGKMGYMEPTPYEENKSVVASLVSDRCAMPKFGETPGVFEGTVNVTLSTSTSGATIYYTTDKTEPSAQNGKTYTGPIAVTDYTNIRAIACKSGMLPSKIVTGTFIREDEHTEKYPSLPIVSITMDQTYYSDDKIGMLVVGSNGKYSEKNCPNGSLTANFNQDWKRPVNFEYIVNGKQVLSQEVEAAVEGGCSRNEEVKSISLKASKKTGKNWYDYRFFQSKPDVVHRTLHVRNGGSAYNCVSYRDGMLQTLAIGMNIDYQAYQPVIYYINGKYIRQMALNERTNADYVWSNYGYDEDAIDLISVSDQLGIKVSKGSDEAYKELINYLKSNDPSSSDYYKGACARMDMDEYIDYNIFEQYIANGDWPGNNMKLWRSKEDGLFRWILFDTDISYGLCDYEAYTNVSRNMIKWCKGEGSRYWANGQDWMIEMFANLSKNKEFKKKFTTKFLINLSTRFSYDHVKVVFDSIGNLARNMDDNYRNMYTFAEQRPQYVYEHLRDYVCSNEESIVNLSIKSNVENARLTLNNEPLSSYKGKYFTNYSFNIKAYAPMGYVFDHWEISDTTHLSLTENKTKQSAYMPGVIAGKMKGDVSLTAVFKKGDGEFPTLVINEICASSDANSKNPDDYNKYPDWIELYNYGKKSIDLSGFRLTNSKDEVVSDLPFNSEKLIIEAGEHKLLWAKGENRLAPTYLNFKLNNDKPSTICLSYYDGETETLVDCIKYESHPTNGSYGREKDNDETWTIFDKCEDGKTLSSTPNTSNGKCGNVIINEVTGESIPTLSLYPNPASDFIQLSCAEPILSCTLYNMDGAVIQRENGDVQGLDIQKYPTGIYMIEVRTLNFIYRSKFIKQ